MRSSSHAAAPVRVHLSSPRLLLLSVLSVRDETCSLPLPPLRLDPRQGRSRGGDAVRRSTRRAVQQKQQTRRHRRRGHRGDGEERHGRERGRGVGAYQLRKCPHEIEDGTTHADREVGEDGEPPSDEKLG